MESRFFLVRYARTARKFLLRCSGGVLAREYRAVGASIGEAAAALGVAVVTQAPGGRILREKLRLPSLCNWQSELPAVWSFEPRKNI